MQLYHAAEKPFNEVSFRALNLILADNAASAYFTEVRQLTVLGLSSMSGL